MKSTTADFPCPCGSAFPYARCCAPLHAGAAANDAAALMRSRYSAYALHLDAYLLATWHPRTRPAQLDTREPPVAKWIGLELRGHEALDADHALVEFVARCRVVGRAQRLHETSRFERIDGRWYYLDGELG